LKKQAGVDISVQMSFSKKKENVEVLLFADNSIITKLLN